MEFVNAKGVLKAVVSPLIDLCGVYDGMLSRRVFSQPSWLVLMYHRVIDTPAADPFKLGMCVRREHFAEQIDYLTRMFTPITVRDAVQRLREGKPLPRNAISVTFDDGYSDFAEHALPVLQRFDCPATIYVSTGGIESADRFWWDRVIAAFAGTRRDRLDLELPYSETPQDDLHVSLANRRSAVIQTLGALWEQPYPRLHELVSAVERELSPTPGMPQPGRLSLEEVSQFDRDSVEVAVHCEQHSDLTRMRSDVIEADIKESRRRLEEAVGYQVSGFAYPGGRQDSRVRQLVARSGFAYAAGTEKGINRRPFESFNLRRIGMPDTSIADFKRCLCLAAGVEMRSISRESVQWP